MRSLSEHYPVWLCDVWGVIHNGVVSFGPACKALQNHRRNGGTVLLVTNAPRRAESVAQQLTNLRVPEDCYDAIVTSGDVTRSLINNQGGGAVYHLGPERDMGIYQGLDTRLVSLDEARAVVCTGLFDDRVETPDDYASTLRRMKAFGLPMICANPDKVVRRGSQIVYCAGAIAEAYERIGGRITMAGKPFPPIYDLAMKMAGDIRQGTINTAEILAIGDGPETDIAGAAGQGFDCVLITGGISDHALSPAAVARKVQAAIPDARIVDVQRDLSW